MARYSFLLTGDESGGDKPQSFLLTGQEIDVCSETVLTLDSGEVKSFNDHLRNVTEEALKRNYNPEKMQKLGVYHGDSDYDYLLEYYNLLKDFIKETANGNYGLLLIF